MTGVPRLEYRLLGRFAVIRDGVEIPAAEFGGRKVRTLLRVLLSRRGSYMSNDALTEMLWPERRPADPGANLQVLVTRARKALGDAGAITTAAGGYAVAGDADVDAERFAAAVERAHLLSGAAALVAFRDAFVVWSGEPLAEDAFAEWAREYRDRLLRARQHALEQAAQLALDHGVAAEAVEYASVAADAEPLREAAVLGCVRALAAVGDAAAALARYDEYRHALADELGIDPSPEAAAVQLQLLSGGAPIAAVPAMRRSTGFAELPFIGRTFHLANLAATLENRVRSTVLVIGASGSGKSRLLQELAAMTPVSIARPSRPERDEAWSLIRSILRELLAQDVTYRRCLTPRLDSALATLLPELEAAPDDAADAETRRALLHEATLRLLEQADAAIVVDDAQWADPTSLAVLEAGRARLDTLRLVLAFRPDELAEPTGEAIGRLGCDLRLELGALPGAAIADVVDADLVDALARGTDGTPMAITEVLRALAGEGAISRGADRRWRSADADALARAQALGEQGQRQAIAARVERQPAEVREVLEAVCLLGREVSIALLATSTARSEEDVLDALGELARAGLVRLGENGWATAHDMISEVASAAMDAPRRHRSHARLAQALEALGEDDREVARHWRGAGESGRAAAAYASAAQRALSAYADAEAAALAEDGLALRPIGSVAAQLHETRAQALSRRGDLSGARENLRAALATQPSGPARSRLLGRLAVLASGSDDLVRAADLAELALVEAGEDAAAQAQALEIAAVLDMNLDRGERATQRFAQAIELYQRHGNAQGTARVLDAQAMATFLGGDITEGAAALRRAADLFEDSGDLVRVATPRSTSGHALVFAGRAADGLAASSAALDLARMLGHPEAQAYAQWHCAEALAALDRVDEASDAAADALGIATRISHRGWTATAWRAVGIAAQAGGRLDDALEAFRASLELSDNLDLFACWAAARAALVLVALGDLDGAAPLVTRALATGPQLGHFEARLAEVELAAARGDVSTGDLARAAVALADRAGYAQGRPRLAELLAPHR